MNLGVCAILFCLTLIWQNYDMSFDKDTSMIMSAVFFVGFSLSIQIWRKP